MTRRSLPAAAVAGALLVLAACHKEAEKEAEPVVPVQVMEARRAPIQRLIHAEGIVRALDQAALVPKISAPVSKFYVNRGDHVRKGQLLAVLENRDLAASVADAKGSYEQAQAAYRNTTSATVPDEVVKAEADVQSSQEALDAAQKLLESRKKLFSEGALARRQVDEASVAYVQAKSNLEAARKHLESLQAVGRHEEVRGAAGQLESAKGKYEAAQAQLSYSEIRSPISGVIADRAVFPGEMASSSAPLLTVMDVSSVIARLNVPPTEAAHIRVGDPARLAGTDSTVTANGRVTVVSPAVDPQSTTVEVWVQAANPGERLRPGATVDVTIMAETIPNAVVVPPAALLPAEGGGTQVMVVGPDSAAHAHKVEVGVRGPDAVQIVSGVQPGERVVVGGGVGLEDGAKVRIQPPGAQSGKPEAGEHE